MNDRSHEELAAEIALLRRELKEAKEKLRADSSADEFISLVSHELRTPLTVIIGALHTAMDKRVSKEEVNVLIRDASTSAESLASILDNMLELSRYQSGRLSLNRKTVKIADIVAKAINRVRQKYDTHQIILDAPDEIPEALFDAVRIEQVLFNLIENAVKYSPEGTEVHVFYQKDERGLIIGVSDRGAGISEKDREKIFEAFSRLEGSASRGVGLGLGLMVCRCLVEAHGGRIWVESEPGKGSTFMFVIP
jgi:signal transduction histidine kinase